MQTTIPTAKNSPPNNRRTCAHHYAIITQNIPSPPMLYRLQTTTTPKLMVFTHKELGHSLIYEQVLTSLQEVPMNSKFICVACYLPIPRIINHHLASFKGDLCLLHYESTT